MDVTEVLSQASRACPHAGDPKTFKASQVLGRIGDKWSVMIIMNLYEGGHRFNELKRAVNGISQRMLTLTLRNLERDGLVVRRVTPSIPPRVDYELTGMGRSLAQPVKALGDWAFAHIEAIESAQSRFDVQGHADAA